MLLGAAAAAVTAYAAYRVYSGPAEEPSPQNGRAPRSKSQLTRWLGLLSNCSNAASSLAESAALVSSDLRTFLTSDATELPQSLRQLNRLLQAPELQDTVTIVSASVVRGVASVGPAPGQDGRSALDTLIEAVLSERGRGLVGMAVGIATRNATSTVCELMERRLQAAASQPGGSGSLSARDILELLTSEHGEQLLTLLLTKSIRTAVTSYVDATTGYNLYDDMLSSIAKQENRDALTDVLTRLTACFCKELVVSYRRAMATGTSPVSAASCSTAPPAAAAGIVPSSSAPPAPGKPLAATTVSSTQPPGATASALAVESVAVQGVGRTAANAAAHSGRGSQQPGAAPLSRQASATVSLSGSSSSGALALSTLGGAVGGSNVGRVLAAQLATPAWLKQVRQARHGSCCQ